MNLSVRDIIRDPDWVDNLGAFQDDHTLYTVQFDDGVIEGISGAWIRPNLIYWKLWDYYPHTPLLKAYCEHRVWKTTTAFDIARPVFNNILHDDRYTREDVDHFLRLLWELHATAINMYTDVRYVYGYDSSHVLRVLEDPFVKECIKNAHRRQNAIQDLWDHVFVHHSRNPFIMAVMSKVSRQTGAEQTYFNIGMVPHANGIYLKPVHSNFSLGLREYHEDGSINFEKTWANIVMVAGLTNASFAAKTVLQDSEALKRQLRVCTTNTVTGVVMTDCKTPLRTPHVIRKGCVKYYVGITHTEGGIDHTIASSDTHLEGTVVNLRLPQDCIHDTTPHGRICSGCFGKAHAKVLAENMSPDSIALASATEKQSQGALSAKHQQTAHGITEEQVIPEELRTLLTYRDGHVFLRDLGAVKVYINSKLEKGCGFNQLALIYGADSNGFEFRFAPEEVGRVYRLHMEVIDNHGQVTTLVGDLEGGYTLAPEMVAHLIVHKSERLKVEDDKWVIDVTELPDIPVFRPRVRDKSSTKILDTLNQAFPRKSFKLKRAPGDVLTILTDGLIKDITVPMLSCMVLSYMQVRNTDRDKDPVTQRRNSKVLTLADGHNEGGVVPTLLDRGYSTAAYSPKTFLPSRGTTPYDIFIKTSK